MTFHPTVSIPIIRNRRKGCESRDRNGLSNRNNVKEKRAQGITNQKENNRKNKMKIIYAYVNGIKGKDASLQSAAEKYEADIIFITEAKTAGSRCMPTGHTNKDREKRAAELQ